MSEEPSLADETFVVRVESWVFVPGQCLKYMITAQEVVVAYQNDYGVKLHEVFRSKLDAAQVERFYSFLRLMPLDTLDSEYIDSGVDDGFQMTFEILVGPKPSKKVVLKNEWQAYLVKLCREINRLVPAKFALHAPEERGTSGGGPNNALQRTHSRVTPLAGRAQASRHAARR